MFHFMLIHCNLIMMIDINQSPVLCPHTNNLQANSLLRKPTLIGYVLRSRAMHCDHKKDVMTNLASLL